MGIHSRTMIATPELQQGWPAVEPATLISVIVPCFNQAGFLPEAIETALGQTHHPVEVVVVDDGSTDETRAVVARYPPGIRYIWQENRGLAAARNAGMAVSRGAFLVFLDSDDRLLPNALEAGLACHRAHGGCAFVYGTYCYIDAHGRRLGPPFCRTPTPDPYAALLRKNHIGMHATVMYQRDALERAGGFNPSLRAGEDYDVYLRIARHDRVAYHHTLVAEYRRHSGTMSNDPARILAANLAVLRMQEQHAKGNARHRRDCRAGLRFAVAKCGKAMLLESFAALAGRRLGGACQALLSALRLIPPFIAASSDLSSYPAWVSQFPRVPQNGAS